MQFYLVYIYIYKYIKRNFLSFKNSHYERRVAIKNSDVQSFLEELTDAIAEYGVDYFLNIDETCIKTINPRHKQRSRKGQSTVKIAHEKLNVNEGTTYIATLPKNPQMK